MARQFGFDPAKGESLVLGEGGTMASVYVAVKSGFGDRKFTAPKEPVILNQVGMHYSPRVLAVMTNQQIEIRNGDEFMHNAHFQPSRNPVFG
ncbi:MAG TPA: hypothetical protein VJS20_07730 [Gemmatimonadales bacterium]|nr:hypothetical protein [Gemmatimonadales bacterium]